MSLVRKLKKLSKRYKTLVTREYDGIYSRYVVDFGGKKPQDFNDYDYNGRINAKKEMINYLEKRNHPV